MITEMVTENGWVLIVKTANELLVKEERIRKYSSLMQSVMIKLVKNKGKKMVKGKNKETLCMGIVK